MPATPIAFSKAIPALQTKVNSSSLGPFKACPRRYYYETVRGLTFGPPSVDLEFGTYVHESLEAYELKRDQGHEEALRAALELAQRMTWNQRLGKPWQSGDLEKNRLTLLRVVVDYADHWAGVPGYKTRTLASGAPAVELQFEFDSGVEIEGERISLVGKIDKIVEVEALGASYVLDTKTTKLEIGKIYTSQYTPNNQFSLYAAAAQVCFAEPVKGMLLDAISVRGGEISFTRLPVTREEAYLEEWLGETRSWLQLMGRYAIEGHWPQNEQSCGLFRGCPWREVCGASPKTREFMLRGLERGRDGGSSK